jgi:thymidylate synthase ThyX
MAFECKIITDSLSPSGSRLTTFEVSFPRCILAEMNTHRLFSRNSASSRAIPTKKIIQRINDDPFYPTWTANQAGMQGRELSTDAQIICKNEWDFARREAIKAAEAMSMAGAHKQNVNRVLEPFMWHTAIITSSRYNNFFSQRCHPDAQPEMQEIAVMMRDTLKMSKPNALGEGNWHLPYITEQDIEEYQVPLLLQLSVARCARVSYLSHDGTHDPEADLALFKKLNEGNHWSPFEHIAMAVTDSEPGEHGNFDSGWLQLRKHYPKEYIQ